jgi:hypothetical protein
MKTFKRQPLLFVVAFAILMAGAIVTLRAQKQKNQSPKETTDIEGQFPIVDFDSPEPTDIDKREKRRKKSKKYDKAIMEIDERADNISNFAKWGASSPLPIDKSVAVVIGQIMGRAAYLSSDKTNVYSEFTVRIDEVLMNNSQVPLTAGSSVAVERDGGRVRFPSGHITTSSIPGQGMPLLGKRYVLFLTHDFPIQGKQGQDLYIQTGYELRAGKVFPLDYQNSDHPFSTAYNNADEAEFMIDLRASIQKAQ